VIEQVYLHCPHCGNDITGVADQWARRVSHDPVTTHTRPDTHAHTPPDARSIDDTKKREEGGNTPRGGLGMGLGRGPGL
jgi:hypothetical protein